MIACICCVSCIIVCRWIITEIPWAYCDSHLENDTGELFVSGLSVAIDIDLFRCRIDMC